MNLQALAFGLLAIASSFVGTRIIWRGLQLSEKGGEPSGFYLVGAAALVLAVSLGVSATLLFKGRRAPRWLVATPFVLVGVAVAAATWAPFPA